MKLLLIAAAAATVMVPGAPPSPPHMHYEIWTNKIGNSPLTDSDRLRAACNLTHHLMGRLGDHQKTDEIVTLDLAVLAGFTCGTPKSN